MLQVDNAVIFYIIFKIVIVLVGALCIYLGYRLFVKGIAGDAGDLEASNKLGNLKLLKAAPGTFLFIMGAIIVCYTLFTSSLNSDRKVSNENVVSSPHTSTDTAKVVHQSSPDTIRSKKVFEEEHAVKK